VTRLPGVVRCAALVAFLANSADNAVLFVVLWVAGPQGWTGVQTALVVLGARLPMLVTGGLLGRAVDRWGARPLLRVDLGLRCLLLLGLVGVAAGGPLPLVAVLLVGGLSGATAPATYAGVRWLLPRVTPAASLGRANAVLALADQLPLVVGAAAAGPVLALLGAGTALLVPAGMLLVAAVAVAWLPRLPPRRATPRPESGARRRRWPPRVTALIALSTAYYLVYGPFESASPAFVRDRLASSEAAYTWLWLLFGVGAVATLPLAPRLARGRPGLVNASGALVWGAVMLPLAVVTDPWLAALLFLVGGAVWGPYTAVETTALQQWTAPEVHGALFGFQRGLLGTAAPVGAALGAAALQVAPAQLVLTVSAAGCAAAGLLALTSRDLRRARCTAEVGAPVARVGAPPTLDR
jgi:predicted MFS family arabinose efflux permease